MREDPEEAEITLSCERMMAIKSQNLSQEDVGTMEGKTLELR